MFRASLRSFLAGLRSWRDEPRQVPDLTLAGRAEAALRDAGLTDWRVYEQDGDTYASLSAARLADADVWACVKALMRAGLHGRPDAGRRGHIRVWE